REAHEIAEDSGLDREVGIERPADLHDLLAGETAAGGELGDRFEVVVPPTRQVPAQHVVHRFKNVGGITGRMQTRDLPASGTIPLHVMWPLDPGRATAPRIAVPHMLPSSE